MRTTLTLDEDIAAKLRAETRRSGRSLKQTVNELLRSALAAPRPKKPPPPLKIEARALGLRPGFDLDDVWGLIDQVEGPQPR